MRADLAELKRRIDTALDQNLPSQSPIAQSLVDAMRYATLSGGKRLRPMLVCAAATAVGGDIDRALAPACAIEFIHAYSLVHDDLPAMDDDELRHGVPSNHVRYGEATAILAGDALQALAFHTLANAPGIPATARLGALSLLAEAAGWSGMVGGQTFDMAAETRNLGLTELESLHGAKTGALIRAAVQIGALIGNHELADEQLALLGEFAARVGLAFQVIDDVLDVTSSTQELGKPQGSDIAASKSTYPSLIGLSKARQLADDLLAEALVLHDRAGLRHDQLAELARRSVHRTF